MKCYLCGSEDNFERDGSCRDNKELKIYECSHCGLVYLSDFFHIEQGFYENNKMVESNKKTKVLNTASYIDTNRRFQQFGIKIANKKILDFGCGEGRFLFKLKQENISNHLFSMEINSKYNEILNKNFIHYNNIDNIPNDSLDVITIFHVLEHLSDPVSILNKLHQKLHKDGKIIIEVPSSNDILINKYNNEAFQNFTYWSCHLYLYNFQTLENLIKKTKFRIDYIKQYQRYSLDNHLYWLSEGKPAGHVEFSFLEDDLLNKLYAAKLAEVNQCDTLIMEIAK